MTLSPGLDLVLFLLAGAVVALAGSRLAYLADRIADRSGLGEAVTGAVFLGGSTSISGLVTSVTAAFNGHPALAISNAVGGIAAQTAFLAVADLFYRRANLEHAAASVPNIFQGALLVTLLIVPVLAATAPEVSLLGVHPATLFMLALYAYGVRLGAQAHTAPMWQPRWTRETREDRPEPVAGERSLSALWRQFAVLAALLSAAGWVIGVTGVAIAARTGLSETAVGGVFTAVTTSLPELVTTIAAVRRGALTLAVGDIIGGNTFDTLFIAIADMAYRGGSLYHAIRSEQVFLFALAILLSGILLMGLVRRERHGIANIGMESLAVLALYLGGMAVLFLNGEAA